MFFLSTLTVSSPSGYLCQLENRGTSFHPASQTDVKESCQCSLVKQMEMFAC